MGRRKGRAEYQTAFGKALDRQLSKRGLRQADLARATKASPAYVNRLMSGEKVSPEWADIIADTLGLPQKERAELHTAAAISWGFKLDLTKK
jgi:transcriptional regulator with XRE-family HTH domain